jgi:hypothetical protein
MVEVYQYKMENKIIGVTIKGEVQNTEVGKRTCMQHAAAWAEGVYVEDT